MKYITLGRTGLKASVAGLGCGGYSRLGLGKNLGDENAINIVETAIDLGVNFFDTSAAYGTEKVLAKGLENQKRENYVISTKFPPSDFKSNIASEGDLTKSLDKSLKNLKTDYIDIFHLHAVFPQMYIQVRDRFLPELIKAKEAGKIRFFGITEMFGMDTNHSMFQSALEDDLWDVIMVGLNLINFSAIKNVFPTTSKNDVGVLIMFAVRNALSNLEKFKDLLPKLIEEGEIDISKFDTENPLGFLSDKNVAESSVDAAYRFCANTNGADVILTGTSSSDHLKSNVKSILSEKLPDEVLDKIHNLFGNVASVSGN